MKLYTCTYRYKLIQLVNVLQFSVAVEQESSVV